MGRGENVNRSEEDEELAKDRFTGEWIREGGVWRVRRLETTPDPPRPNP
jgi:hypothetical protein